MFVRLIAAAAMAVVAAGAALAAVVDPGPPYTNEQFVIISQERVPEQFKANLPVWWAKAPQYLKDRILAAPSEMWWAIILCNYQGFKPESTGQDSAAACEKQWYKNSQRGKQSWSPDGLYVEPSEACIKRNKRSQWGELICD